MATRSEISDQFLRGAPLRRGERKTTFLSLASSLGALIAACSCCILPMALAGIGVSTGFGSVLSPLGPLRWPLTAISIVAVSASWFMVLRQRRFACAGGQPPARKWLLSPRMILLIVATAFTLVAAAWSFLEPTVMNALVQWRAA